ncbi:MAG: glycine-rich domain-containing protein-like [Myxococcota bacterium]
MHPEISLPAAVELPNPTVDLARAARRSEQLPSDWDDAAIAQAILRYRRFLHLVGLSPTTPIAPTRDIDFIWHLHMLSPRAYQADCMRLFGAVLDHDGGFGQTADEEPVLIACFERTAARWLAAFGESYVVPAAMAAGGGAATNCWHDCSGRCWHACSSIELAPAERLAA